MNRATFLQRIVERSEPWDIAIVGGGATGLGIAVDAAQRGYAVVLVEQSDFGKGTSSRSTKLVHGGVRYLQQGNISLVRESLQERGLLLRNAPHLVHDLEFLVPGYRWWEKPFYGIGMKVYDTLSGKYSFGKSRILSRKRAIEHIPTLQPNGLRGGVKYHDGQFDDARVALALAQTAAEEGACVVNYARVTNLIKSRSGHTSGIAFRDEETGSHHPVSARCVINATGAFCDELRHADDPTAPSLIAASQGAHIVLPREFLPGSTALMVPRTRDGRVMFAIPWYGHVVVGTTDTAIDSANLEPSALDTEIDFILETAAGYLATPPTRADILSVFTGIRPLVRATKAKNTAKLSRDHTIQISPSGLLTITGGKWTTYRHMAEDAVNQAAAHAQLPAKPCATRERPLHGFHENAGQFGALSTYGSDAPAVVDLTKENAELAKPLHPALPITGAQVVWAARHEMARTIDDVLARRTRALFLNQAVALVMAPAVARLLAAELGRDDAWQRDQLTQFKTIAAHFSVPPNPTNPTNP
jgi:glycerol-3-phosphate dehydrogenase